MSTRKSNPSKLSAAIANAWKPTEVKPVVIKGAEEHKKKLEEHMLAPFVSVTLLEERQASIMDWRLVQFRLYAGEQMAKSFRHNFHGDFNELTEAMEDAINALHAASDRYNEDRTKMPFLTSMEAAMCRTGLRNTDVLHTELPEEHVLKIYEHVQNFINRSSKSA